MAGAPPTARQEGVTSPVWECWCSLTSAPSPPSLPGPEDVSVTPTVLPGLTGPSTAVAGLAADDDSTPGGPSPDVELVPRSPLSRPTSPRAPPPGLFSNCSATVSPPPPACCRCGGDHSTDGPPSPVTDGCLLQEG
ncbi:hypothetical protein ZWY2020_035922 [Hordeum vulgare]|nr:hypothetical protein ZWY2020_035922 [Hordeum vulgare]